MLVQLSQFYKYMALVSTASNWLFKTAISSVKEKVSSPLSAQILEFCESELFPETLQDLEVASTSNCCYEDQSCSNTNFISFPPPPMDINAAGTTTKPPTATNSSPDTNNNNNFSIIFEDDEITENDINLDFTTSPNLNDQSYQFGHQDQFDLSLLQFPLTTSDDNIINNLTYPHPHQTDHVVPVMGPAPLPTDIHDSFPPSKFMRFNNPNSSPNFSFMDASINSYLSGNSNPLLPLETCGIFNGNNLFQPHDQLDFKGDIFCPDPLPPPYNSNELQALSNESQQHLVNGGGSSATPLASEITGLEPETFRVTNKLTTEERKEKIHRYMKKRNERNFSKKIKYACRKTLADSRPRVRGRFAKNDEFGENNRTTCSNHEEDTDEDVVVKEEQDNFESSDIFAHLSGVNSFRCNYPSIQSWI